MKTVAREDDRSLIDPARPRVFLDVAVLGLAGFSILLDYTLGGLIVWVGLAWVVASLMGRTTSSTQ